MQEFINQSISSLKRFFGEQGPKALRKAPKQEPIKVIHVQLVEKLNRVSLMIGDWEAEREICEKARFIVENAPLGTVPSGEKPIRDALKHVQRIAKEEPQLRRHADELKALTVQYLGQKNES